MTIHEARTKQGSIGRIIPTFEARLVADGKDVGRGESGELWLRGPSVMKGYLRNEVATRNTFDGEGKGRWFKTGDVAVVDDDGYFTLVNLYHSLWHHDIPDLPYLLCPRLLVLTQLIKLI